MWTGSAKNKHHEGPVHPVETFTSNPNGKKNEPQRQQERYVKNNGQAWRKSKLHSSNAASALTSSRRKFTSTEVSLKHHSLQLTPISINVHQESNDMCGSRDLYLGKQVTQTPRERQGKFLIVHNT